MCDFLVQICRSMQMSRGLKRNQYRKFSGVEQLETRRLLAADFGLVKDVNPLSDSSPSSLTNVNGTLYFTADDGTNGMELWKSNGTAGGTIMVKNIRSDSLNGTPGDFGSFPQELTNVNGTLYFTADDGTNGEQLWRTNGTAAGTVLVKKIGSGFSGPSSLTNVNGTLYFTADDGTNGEQLWRTNGTAAGTVLVKKIGSGFPRPSSLTNVNGTLYFRADDRTNGLELWKSNGTAAGTIMVKNINSDSLNGTPGNLGSSPQELTNVNGTLYFAADDGTNGSELWRSDGTAAGTILVKDIDPRVETFAEPNGEVFSVPRSSNPSSLTNVNGTLYLAAKSSNNYWQLLRSDGTATGTVVVKNIGFLDPAYELTNVNGTLYYAASDGTDSKELWKSNGTTAGTLLVAGQTGSSSLPTFGDALLTNVNGMLYFGTNDGDLWKSNGTATGTAMATDRVGRIEGIVVVNNLVYVRGRVPAIGSELYVQDLTRGTEFNDAFVLRYSGTGSDQRVTVTLSTNGGPVETLGIFPTTFPLPITGLGGNDSVRIEGTTGADTFVGEASRILVNGAPVLLSGIESHSLAGGAGNDSYQFDADTSLGAFTLDEAGGGVDTINLAATAAAVTLNLGTPAIQTVNANLSLILNSGSTFDNAVGGSGADTLTGNGLSNTLIGGPGSDHLIGAAGDDTYVFNPVSVAEADQVTENLNEGLDTLNFASLTTSVVVNLGTIAIQPVHLNRTLKLNSVTTFENVIGGSGADTLTGNGLSNTLTDGPGSDRMFGAAGDDTYVFNPASVAEADQVTENLNEGTDTLNFSALSTNVTLHLGWEPIQPVHLNRTLKLNSLSTFENAIGGSAADNLIGNSRNNTLIGGAGSDTLNGAAGSDFLFGGADSDTYLFGPASAVEADQVTENTGEGTDTLSFAFLTSSVVANLGATSIQTVHTNRTLKLNSSATFENFIGGTAADTLVGNSLNNTLTGGPGDDKLNGAVGNDLLIGGANNDTYLFGTASIAETDQVRENANDGLDTLDFSFLTTDVVLNLGSTAVQSVHTNRRLQLNSLSTFENAVGGTGSDTLLGNALANRLTGGNGNNILVGLEAGDVLVAGSGRDILIGGLGLDVLNGGTGDDILIAGRTSVDTSVNHLGTLRTQWISANAYAVRVSNLQAGVGSPMVSLKARTNVLSDAGENDVLAGGTGTDWYFRALDDVISGLVSGEIIDVL
jgi:ELWxxDGT repeat protein